MNIQLAIAGISHELELRLSLACNLLHASDISIDIRPWMEGLCDVVVVDMSDGFGSLVYGLAVRRQLPILAFTREPSSVDIGTKTLDPNASIAMIAKTLREIFVGKRQLHNISRLPGLLGIASRMQASDEAAIARSGGIEVMLRPAAGRIQWKSRSDLSATQIRFVDKSWSVSRVTKLSVNLNEWSNSCSLDSFFVTACRRHDNVLPVLGQQAYRLKSWPDLGGVVDDIDVLRLTVALLSSTWSVKSLAYHAGISVARVNSFFIATLVIGALEKEALSIHSRPGITSNLSSLFQRKFPSLIEKVAYHFGMRI